jgi:hypothetical protein
LCEALLAQGVNIPKLSGRAKLEPLADTVSRIPTYSPANCSPVVLSRAVTLPPLPAAVIGGLQPIALSLQPVVGFSPA